MSIGSIVGRIIPAATAFVTSGGNPVAAVAAGVQADKQRDQAKKIRLQNEAAQKQFKENMTMAMGSGEFGTPGLTFTSSPQQQLGFMDRLTNIGSQSGS